MGWGCPIDLLVSKDFHIGHIVGIVERRTLEEQEGEVPAFDRSNPSRDFQNLLAEVDPRSFFEAVDAPVAVVPLQLYRKAEDPWGCGAAVVVVVAACTENYFEDSVGLFASFSEFEIAGLLVFGCQFEAHVRSHSL